MIRNDMRRPTNEHEIFRGRMKQGNSRTEFGKKLSRKICKGNTPRHLRVNEFTPRKRKR